MPGLSFSLCTVPTAPHSYCSSATRVVAKVLAPAAAAMQAASLFAVAAGGPCMRYAACLVAGAFGRVWALSAVCMQHIVCGHLCPLLACMSGSLVGLLLAPH